MFVSLNKKFIYSIAVFFIFTALLFIYTFYLAYGKKLEEEQQSVFTRNQQYLELLYENITLRKELRKIVTENPSFKPTREIKNMLFTANMEENKLDEWSRQKKQIDETIKNYDKRYAALKEGFQIIGYSSILIAASIWFLWSLMRRWVLTPIKRLTEVSNNVAAGNLNVRIPQTDSSMPDEFDKLTVIFNQMLDKLEKNIAEIKSTEAFLQSLLDSIPDGIRVIDEDYNIIMANRAYYQQIGSRRHISQKCYASSQNFDKPCPQTLMSCPLHEICHNRKSGVKVIQQFHAHPDMHLSINAAPLKFTDKDNQKRLYIVESIRDLSDDIKFSHQQKLSSLGFLATSVAHEMKNNLGSIRMITEGLLNKFYQNPDSNEEEKHYMEMIHNQIVNSINIPERLLKLAQFSSEEMTDINCQSNIEEVIALLDYEAKHRGTVINFNSTCPEALIRASEPDFRMVMVNLLLNALKAMPGGGKLDLGLSCTGKTVTISVKDNGIGIAADKLNRIFEPFFSEGQNDLNKGTGLGLPIVKSIVNKFGGSINVSSKIGKGSTFTVKFPKSSAK